MSQAEISTQAPPAAPAAAPPPKSSDPMVAKLSFLLEQDLRERPDTFCIQNESLQVDEISSHDGLLSLFLYKASATCMEVMDKKLPLHFEADNSALIDVVPVTDQTELNLFSLWTHFLSYSVEEEIRRIKREKKLINGQVPLDELYKKWHQAVAKQQYQLKPSPRPQNNNAN